MTDPARRRRLIWFADLESLVERLEVLQVLQGEIGLTTVAPESHLSHTSGFTASASIAASSPLADWRTRPGLLAHREGFGVPEPAMAVLPGVLGGVDDGPLLRVIDACRRLGLEVWGHAGVWSYGAEVFPELAAVDLWGRSLLPSSLPWGTMFCPSKTQLNDWIGRSLADAAAQYDLDGWFLDHARYTSPAHGPTLFACACSDCTAAAADRGVDLADIRRAVEAGGGPSTLPSLLDSGALQAWFEVRAAILADRFGGLERAIAAASPRPVDFGSDVFPPSVALLGGHAYDRWAGAGATYLTGGFTPNIGWGSVGRIMAASLRGQQRGPDGDLAAYMAELDRMAAVRPSIPVYPPIAGPPEPEVLATMCRAIVATGLEGAMVAGLEATTAAQRDAIRQNLSGPLL